MPTSKKVYRLNGRGDLCSKARDARRAAGWPSGRQWRKMRKEARRAAR